MELFYGIVIITFQNVGQLLVASLGKCSLKMSPLLLLLLGMMPDFCRGPIEMSEELG
jgi:hypothetical protein